MTYATDLLWSCDPSDQAAFRQAAIAQAAYFRAEKRGFAPGHALDDWLAAEHAASSAPGSASAAHERCSGISAPVVAAGQ